MIRKDGAIEWFTMLKEKFIGTKYAEYLDMAIKALEAPPDDNWEGYSSRLWKAAYERGKADAEQTNALDKIIAEIREWYWEADKQALAKDPCVVDAMIDLFIRTINKYKAESEGV